MLCVLIACDSTPVEPPQVPTTITIEPGTVTLDAVGASTQLSAVVKDQNGRAMAGVTLTWSSGDPPIARVSPSGLVVAVGNGSTEVTVTAGSATGRARISVRQVVTEVVVLPAVDTLATLGDTVRLVAMVKDANGSEAVGVDVAWMSTDTLVARVDSGGLVTAVGNSRYSETSASRVPTEVTAMAGPATGRASILVQQAVARVVVSPSADTVWPGGFVQLDAEAFDANGHVVHYEGRVDGVPTSDKVFFKWSSSSPAVADVDDPEGAHEQAGGVAVVVDLDPQGSARTWSELRRHKSPLVASARPQTLVRVLQAARSAGATLALVDTGPREGGGTREAARQADFVLIPSRPAAYDLATVPDTLAAIAPDETPAAIVLTCCPPRGPLPMQAAEYIREIGAALAPRHRRPTDRPRLRQHRWPHRAGGATADAQLDDVVVLHVLLPPGSPAGPVIEARALFQLGVHSAPRFRAYIAAYHLAWRPGVTRRPHPRNRRFHMWSSDPGNYLPHLTGRPRGLTPA